MVENHLPCHAPVPHVIPNAHCVWLHPRDRRLARTVNATLVQTPRQRRSGDCRWHVRRIPAGADAVSRLFQDRQITAKQAVVLAAASHFANPMMIILVVGAAFLHQPAAGYFLLAVHWISGWIAAILATRLLPAPGNQTNRVGSTAAQTDNNSLDSQSASPASSTSRSSAPTTLRTNDAVYGLI